MDSLLVESNSSIGSEAYSEDSEEDEDLENSNVCLFLAVYLFIFALFEFPRDVSLLYT